jgi:flagellar hook-length control protein FliK
LQTKGAPAINGIDAPPPPDPISGVTSALLVQSLPGQTAVSAEAGGLHSTTPPPSAADEAPPEQASTTIPPALVAALHLAANLPAAPAPPDNSKPPAPARATATIRPALPVPEPISSAASTAVAHVSATIVATAVSAAAAADGAERPAEPGPVDQTAPGRIRDDAVSPTTGASPKAAVDQISVAANAANISTTVQLQPALPAGPGGEQTPQPGDSGQNARNGNAGPASSNSPPDTPLVGLPFTPPMATAVTTTDQSAATLPASDQQNASPPTDATDSRPGSAPAGKTNPHAPLLGTVPAALQAHAANYVGMEPNGGAAPYPAQVIEQAAWAIQVTHSSGHEMQLQLTPPDLGALQVSVSVRDGVLSARLETQNPATQRILADNLSQLKDSLTQQGVTFDRIDVHLAGSNTGSGGSGATDPSFGGQPEGNIPWDQAAAYVPAEGDDPLRNQPGPHGTISRAPLTSLDVMV